MDIVGQEHLLDLFMPLGLILQEKVHLLHLRIRLLLPMLPTFTLQELVVLPMLPLLPTFTSGMMCQLLQGHLVVPLLHLVVVLQLLVLLPMCLRRIPSRPWAGSSTCMTLMLFTSSGTT